MLTRKILQLISTIIIILILVISPSFGTQGFWKITSNGRISYQEEPDHLPQLHVEGTYIRDMFGNTIYLKGVNFNTDVWWTRGLIDEQQIVYMKQWGANVIRITITGWAVPKWNTDEAFRSKMDDIISWAEIHGIYVVISGYHLTIDGSFPYHCDISGWEDNEWNDWIAHWESIATRYSEKTNVLYDLLNEPIGVESRDAYKAGMEAAIDAIRTIDHDSLIIAEAMSTGDWTQTEYGFHWVETHPIERTNIIYSGHLYQSEWRPEYTKEAIRQRMTARKWNVVLENNLPLWVGEFNTENAYIGDPTYNGEAWLRNYIEIMEEDGFAGFAAWYWNVNNRHALLTGWNGSPSASGTILQEYLHLH